MLYKITIKPLSSFSYPIQSDTLFGAFCWSYKYKKGEEELKKFLEKCIDEKPPIIFSNMFVQDTLPIPLYTLNKMKNEYYNEYEKKDIKKYFEEYNKIKRISKNSVLSKEVFLELLESDYKLEDTYKKVVDNIKLPELYLQTEMHNMISRDTNMVNDGSLYGIDTYFSKENFDIYILCEEENMEEYKPILELMFKLGIGAEKSTGKGCFEIKNIIEEKELVKNIKNIGKKEVNGFISLSNFIPAKDDPIEGYYSIISKFPKLDREFANSEMPFKKPLAMIEAGSCFYYDKDKEKYKDKEYCGACLPNMAKVPNRDELDEDEIGIIINACGIAIPMPMVKPKDEDNN